MIGSMTMSISGMNASAARLQASASNIANADTTGALAASGGSGPAAYQPIEAVQASLGGTGGGGVSVTYAPRTPAFIAAYDPEALYADAEGMVAAPNVDLAAEAVDVLAATMSFRANLAAFRVEAQASRELLDVLA
jgi:flagellar basal-body rod protein FlgC